MSSRQLRGLSPSSNTRAQMDGEEALLDDDNLTEDSVQVPSLLDTRDLPVYVTIHRIRREITIAIDDPYSLEQLKDPRMNVSVVRPLVDRYYAMNDVSIIFCLLVNRLRFLREQVYAPHHQSVNITRALLCELVAHRILRRFNEDNDGPEGLLLLSTILVTSFDPFQNAPQALSRVNSSHVLYRALKGRGTSERRLPALEVAILSESKTLLSSSACQKVVGAIYRGQVIYTPSTFMDILPDRYKFKPIQLYNPREAPLLNQYRLIVPRTRNYLELFNFVILLSLYVTVMADRNPTTFSTVEGVFMIYAFGWVLDLFASVLEHGWTVYTQNLWAFLDATFAVIYAVYFILRIMSLATGDVDTGWQALDVLAIGAPVLVPRLAFNLLSENMLFVSLRAMMADFTILTLLAAWCFAGFLLSMTWLSNGLHSPGTVAKWMVYVWFGLDATGVDRSPEFHWILGPILMITFAALGNTLFLTILVSMLSSTFANISGNAAAEIQFRRAVLTLEGVKSDAIFAYLPPFNILAVLVLFPLRYLMTPRWFHKINVAFVRTLNFPLLILIAFLERRDLWDGSTRREPKTRSRSLWDGFSGGFSAHGDVMAVFDEDPPESLLGDIETTDLAASSTLQRPITPLRGRAADEGVVRNRPGVGNRQKSRRDSLAPFAGLREHLQEMLRSEMGEDGSEDNHTQGRLQALEATTSRIEGMLRSLCEREDVGDEERGEIEPLEEGDKILEQESHE